MSYYKHINKEKLKHVKKAQKYAKEFETIVSQSTSINRQHQIALEQCILGAMMALLDFEPRENINERKERKKHAIESIERFLNDLPKEDPKISLVYTKTTDYWKGRLQEDIP